MNKLTLKLIACLIVSAGCSANVKNARESSRDAASPSLMPTNLAPGQAVLRFAVSGMTCDGCAGGLRSELLAATGVKAAEVSLKDARAVVICDTNRTDSTQLLKVIKEAGFEGKPLSP